MNTERSLRMKEFIKTVLILAVPMGMLFLSVNLILFHDFPDIPYGTIIRGALSFGIYYWIFTKIRRRYYRR